MKIKQVCEATDLTEKAVRLYIKQELVHPTVTEGLHNQSFDFSEEDIRQLKTVAAFRAAGFSMADIREIQLHPEQLPDFLEEQKALLKSDIRRKEKIAAALDRLDAAQTGDMSAVADAMRPAERQELESGGSGYGLILVLAAAALIAIWLGLRNTSVEILLLAVGFIGVLAGAVCMFMAVRYGTCTGRAAKLPNRAIGRVISVTKQTGFDGAFAIQTAATAGAPRWGGNGGIWAIFFMLWGEIRPDHWVPVIHFADGSGKEQSGTFQYGGLKSHFREGETLEIAWGKYPSRVQPLDAPWLRKKAAVYFLIGAVLFLSGGYLFVKIFPLLVQPYVM